jgi:phenylalanyl-tRNA synthetase beta chain
MPVVGIPLNALYRLVNKRIDKDQLYTYLTSLGCDVEGYFEVARYRCSKCGDIVELTPAEEMPGECSSCGVKFEPGTTFMDIGKSEVVRMELLPARPDMFDVGGLARALRGYLGLETGLPKYDLAPSGMSVTVHKSVKAVRPCIACAVAKGMKFDHETIRTIMKMQENLHWALGRDRKKASIGVYDLSAVKPDFEYKAFPKFEFRFVPLGGMPQTGMKPAILEEILTRHPKGLAYKHLLEEYEAYPILFDSVGQVLSMPPIINSEETKVGMETKDLFLDVTGHETAPVEKTLNVLVSSLAELGAKVETVDIIDGETAIVTPNLEPRDFVLSPRHASSLIGQDISPQDCAMLLEKMRFEASTSGGRIDVKIPAFRTDVMHECDLIEDIAIAYGYHNIKRTLVPNMTVGTERPIEKRCARLRSSMHGLGFLEVVTMMLTNTDRNYALLRRDDDSKAAIIENPSSSDHTIVRTHLISGLLDMFKINRTQKMPQRIYELGDVSVIHDQSETGAVDRRTLAGAIMDPKTGFAEIKSCAAAVVKENGGELLLRADNDPAFIEGRCAAIIRGDVKVGVLGEIHPQVLENFEIVQPVSLFHLTVA